MKDLRVVFVGPGENEENEKKRNEKNRLEGHSTGVTVGWDQVECCGEKEARFCLQGFRRVFRQEIRSFSTGVDVEDAPRLA